MGETASPGTTETEIEVIPREPVYPAPSPPSVPQRGPAPAKEPEKVPA
jgi:hypothetical protein